MASGSFSLMDAAQFERARCKAIHAHFRRAELDQAAAAVMHRLMFDTDIVAEVVPNVLMGLLETMRQGQPLDEFLKNRRAQLKETAP